MNIIRTIEGTTLMVIGAFCAAVLMNFAVHGTQTHHDASKFDSSNTIATVQLNPIVIHGKRMTPAQKAAFANAHQLG